MDLFILYFKKNIVSLSFIFGGIGLASTLLIYIISIVTGKVINLNIGPIKLSTGGLKQKKNDYYKDAINKIEGLLSFFDKDNYKSQSLVDSIVEETTEKTEEKDRVLLKESVTKQMIQADESNVQIKVLLTEKYAELLRKKLEDNVDVKQHRDYRFYQIIISSILEEMKRSTLKQSIQNTDILNFSELEFDSFVDQKASVMITIIIEYLDFMYSTSSVISRDVVHKENEKLKKEIKEVLKTLFRNIKQIIIEDKELISRINNKLHENIEILHDRYKADNPVIKIQNILDKEK